MIEDGWITGFGGVKRLSLTVRIQKYGIEGAIFAVHGVPKGTFSFVSLSSTEAQSTASQRVYRIFDCVRVHIEVSSSSTHDDEGLVLTLFES